MHLTQLLELSINVPGEKIGPDLLAEVWGVLYY
jgi:hypothetical protein